MKGRPSIPMVVRRVVWMRLRGGASVEAAATAAGVSPNSVLGWLRDAGGVIPASAGTSSGRYLSFAEREEIAALHERGKGVREIADNVGRNPSTISRELRRCGPVARYRPSAAQARVERARHRRRPGRVKLLNNPRLRVEVERRLRARLSPEQIAGRLKIDFPDDLEMRVSAETIYQSLYIEARGGLKRELVSALRTGRAIRKPRRVPGQRRSRIPNMVLISNRPEEVEDRSIPGHWEGDLIMGSVASNSAIGTLVERGSGTVLLLHLPDGHTAEKVQAEAIRVISTLPDQLRRTLTWDQGGEMAQHLKIAEATGIDIYFCDPHSPWQRGSNENTNGLLRQYFRKGTDLSVHDRATLDLVAAEMNSRPRKRHGFRTPAEQLATLLDEDAKRRVASQT